MYKNKVGRPSNATLKKRKIIEGTALVIGVIIMAGLGFCIGRFLKGIL